QRPADRLRKRARHRYGEKTADAQYPRHLLERLRVVPQVLEHLGDDDAVEGAIRERQRVAAAAQHAPRTGAGNRSARLGRQRIESAQRLDRAAHLFTAGIERDARHPRHEARRAHVAALAATDVEHALSRLEPEALELDRQHRAATRAATPSAATAAAGAI